MGGDVTTAQTAATEAAAKHKGCRKSQKSWSDYKNLALAAGNCPGAGDMTTMHAIFQAHKTVFSAMTLAETQAQEYSNLVPVGVVRECDQDQNDYEDKYCLWRAARYYACTGLESCITQVDLVGLKASLGVRGNN